MGEEGVGVANMAEDVVRDWWEKRWAKQEAADRDGFLAGLSRQQGAARKAWLSQKLSASKEETMSTDNERQEEWVVPVERKVPTLAEQLAAERASSQELRLRLSAMDGEREMMQTSLKQALNELALSRAETFAAEQQLEQRNGAAGQTGREQQSADSRLHLEMHQKMLAQVRKMRQEAPEGARRELEQQKAPDKHGSTLDRHEGRCVLRWYSDFGAAREKELVVEGNADSVQEAAYALAEMLGPSNVSRVQKAPDGYRLAPAVPIKVYLVSGETTEFFSWVCNIPHDPISSGWRDGYSYSIVSTLKKAGLLEVVDLTDVAEQESGPGDPA